MKIETIGLDADDTLWHYERHFSIAQARIASLMSPYIDSQSCIERLNFTEQSNLELYGYGVKSFALSALEACATMNEGKLPGEVLIELTQLAKEILSAEIELLPSVEASIPGLAERYRLMLITKGDLHEQERKIARCGLEEHFRYIEIVSDKTPARYLETLRRSDTLPERFMMVGNSLRSDIWPVLEIGGFAVYIPSEYAWEHESAETPEDFPDRFFQLQHMGQLGALLDRIASSAKA